MQELSQIGLMPEDWGGDIPMVKVWILQRANLTYILQWFFFSSNLANAHLFSSLLLQISALKGENVDELLETVMLVAEVVGLFLCNFVLFGSVCLV